MNKKVISSVLAGAMAVSTLGVTASAGATVTGNTKEGNLALTTKASMLEATIDADLPQDLETFINPYGAAVSTTATTAVNTAVKYTDGIVSPTYSITNYSNTTGIKVTATAKITPSSTVAVNTKALDEAKLQKATEKQVFAFLNTTTDAVAGASLDKAKPVFSDTAYVGNDQQLAFTEDGAKASGIMNISKAAAAGTADIGAMGWFYVGGQCTPDPETAWDSKDTITVDLVLDLSPTMGDPADLTLKSITTDAAGTISIEKDFDGTKKVYEMAAKGSLTKAASIKVTANFAGSSTTPVIVGANVYVKYNGKLFTATSATATEKQPGITITAASTSGGAAGNVVVTPPKTGKDASNTAIAGDYNVGDVLEFIVVDSVTNESTTYVINFT